MADNNNTIKPKFLSGGILRAKDLQRLADLIITKITGGKGIAVRKFGDRLVIENTRKYNKSVSGGSGGAEIYPVVPVADIYTIQRINCKRLGASDEETENNPTITVWLQPNRQPLDISGGGALGNSYGKNAFTLFNGSNQDVCDVFLVTVVNGYPILIMPTIWVGEALY